MPNKHGSVSQRGPMARGTENRRHADVTSGGRGGDPGRSGSSPGHLKKEAGARSAREYAPGRIDRGGDAGAVLREVAPDEIGEA